MEECHGICNIDFVVPLPQLYIEHHESMGAGHLWLHLSDPADHMPYDVCVRGAAARDGGQHKAAA